MIEIYQGETCGIKLLVVDTDGNSKDLEGGTAICAYRRDGDLETDPVEVVCTVIGNEVSVVLGPGVTQGMSGIYDLEFKVKDSLGAISMVRQDQLRVKNSLIPTYGA